MGRAAFAVVVVAALGLGCQATDRTDQLEANKALVRRAHAEVWSGGDMDAATQIYAPDFVGHWTGRPDTHGLDEFIAFVTDGRTQFPNWNETVEQIVAEGNLVVTRFTSRGTYEGEPSDGSEVTIAEIAVHRIVDGKIAEQWTVADILSMREQLGTLDPPADASTSEP